MLSGPLHSFQLCCKIANSGSSQTFLPFYFYMWQVRAVIYKHLFPARSYMFYWKRLQLLALESYFQLNCLLCRPAMTFYAWNYCAQNYRLTIMAYYAKNHAHNTTLHLYLIWNILHPRAIWCVHHTKLNVIFWNKNKTNQQLNFLRIARSHASGGAGRV